MFGLRNFRDVDAGVLEREKLASAGYRDRIVEVAAPCWPPSREQPGTGGAEHHVGRAFMGIELTEGKTDKKTA
jgi:hypothetical protein